VSTFSAIRQSHDVPEAEIGDSDLYFSDSQGGITPLPVPPNLMGMQFWRVIQ